MSELCEEELPGRYTLEVIDVYQQPQLARTDQVIATPTLVKVWPRPVRRCIGSLLNLSGLFGGLLLLAVGQAAP